MACWDRHAEGASRLTALREEVLDLLKEAQVLAARAARIRSLNHRRLRLPPSSVIEDVSRLSEDRLVLGAVVVEPRGSTH